ncbi:PAS domain-containing protein [Arcobacter sp. LA11]|uniref:PAS domain-containing protein n=1 Tax=Arcobacter sp. LA11 TaxID=1898176 RepID=UPI0009344C82|nr:PAS domain-containing protein [Arcobacter sp. LA11]
MLDPEEEYYKLLEVYSKNVIASKTDLKGKIVYVSEAFCDISGYTREELMGQPHSIVRHPDTPSSLFEELWKTIKATKTFKAEIKNKKKCGDYYWVDMTVSPIFDDFNNVVGYGAVRHDITDKKKIEELNIEHEKLIDSFSQHVIASKTDLLGNITYVTQAFCDISGYTKEELIGQPHSIVRHPDMSKEFYKKLWKAIKNGKTFYGEVKNKKKNGDDYWVDVAITQDFDKNGNHIGYSAIRSNISKQKILEDLLACQKNEAENEIVSEK